MHRIVSYFTVPYACHSCLSQLLFTRHRIVSYFTVPYVCHSCLSQDTELFHISQFLMLVTVELSECHISQFHHYSLQQKWVLVLNIARWRSTSKPALSFIFPAQTTFIVMILTLVQCTITMYMYYIKGHTL